MKKAAILYFLTFFATSIYAQDDEGGVRLSAQTDLLAYTTANGWSIWGTAQYDLYKFSVAFDNYPNRYRSIYDEIGIKETGRWMRFQLSRHFKPTSSLRNFHYGVNIEHHWRELKEDNNPGEILKDTHWQLGVFIGYIWTPWKENENALTNFFIAPWLGLNFLPTNTKMARVFENTASIYPIPGIVRPTIGINIGYTFYKN